MKSKLSNILDAIAAQKLLLSLTGCWPQRKPSFFYRCKYVLCWSIDLTFQIFLFWELSKNLELGEYKAMTELLSFMGSEVPYLFKHLIFDLKSRRFMDALDRLKQPMFNEYPQQCDKYVQSTIKIARWFIKFYQFVVLTLVLLYLLKPFFSQEITAIRFSVFDLGPLRWVFHFYQVVCIGMACLNNSTFDLLSLGIISIGSAQFEILKDKLENSRRWAGLTNEEIDSGVVNPDLDMDPKLDCKVNKYLGECVKHHLEIFEYVIDIESVFTYYFLVQFADSVLAICNTWFQFMLEDNFIKILFLIMYTVTLLTQLFMYCIYGNTLMLRSEELRDACYNSNWHKSGNKVRKTLILIMERTKRRTILTAGKFSMLNLASYMGLLKMSYSYFALMNHLYGN